MQSQPLFSSP
uniref:Uncharacterized protein n=1 Tax=Anguilla anguilla TaxID=7936 RepID=A0A0E9P740_ANGAN